jgi:hypothetical protein
MRGRAALMAAAFLALSACGRSSDIVITKNYLPATLAAPGECWRVLLETPRGELKPICVSKGRWELIKIGDKFNG